MSLDFHSASSAEPVDYDEIGLHPNWGERIVTVVATTIAVLIVAVIAVLMGMA
jgi:hypothetical protein